MSIMSHCQNLEILHFWIRSGRFACVQKLQDIVQAVLESFRIIKKEEMKNLFLEVVRVANLPFLIRVNAIPNILNYPRARSLQERASAVEDDVL